jgi:hypothetical protein
MGTFLYTVSDVLNKGEPYIEIVLLVGMIVCVIFTFSAIWHKTDDNKMSAP